MCVLWGMPYLLIKVAVEHVSPPVVVLARCGLGAAVLLPIAIAKGYLRPLIPHWRWLLAFTALEITGPWLLLSDAERHLSSSFSGLLIAAVPIVAAVVSLFIGEERLDRTRVMGLAIGIAGVVVLLGLDLEGEVWAAIELALVVIGYGTAPLIISRKLSDVPSLGVIAAALTITAVFYAPFAAISWPEVAPPAKVYWSLAGLAAFCTIAAFLIFFSLIGEAGPNRALVITFVNPAVALLLGVLLLDEPLTKGLLLGFPLVLLGCILATRKSRASTPVPAIAEP